MTGRNRRAKPRCVCALKGSKDGGVVSPRHDKNCPFFISPRILSMLRRRMQAPDKYRDSREHELFKLAGRRLKLEHSGKNWAIRYEGRGTVSGLVPDFLGIPRSSNRKLDLESIYAQIRDALVNFALEVLNNSKFKNKRNT